MLSILENGILLYNNKVNIGIIYREIDGYLVYVPNSEAGFYCSYKLRMVADFLDDLNKEWDDKIKNDPILNESENDNK